MIAERLGVRILTDPDWKLEQSVWYGEFEEFGPFILMPAVIPIRLERWAIAHELGHHMTPGYYHDRRLWEVKADRWAVDTLLQHYAVDEVDWPPHIWGSLQGVAA